eukprot:9122430-Pyramimonas_sp.AAC.1
MPRVPLRSPAPHAACAWPGPCLGRARRCQLLKCCKSCLQTCVVAMESSPEALLKGSKRPWWRWTARLKRSCRAERDASTRACT